MPSIFVTAKDPVSAYLRYKTHHVSQHLQEIFNVSIK